MSGTEAASGVDAGSGAEATTTPAMHSARELQEQGSGVDEPPAPAAPPPLLRCIDACQYTLEGVAMDLTNDTFCDDGGPGSQYSLCSSGTDCTDCGPRGLPRLEPTDA